MYRVAIPLVRGGFLEKFEKLRYCPRPGLEPMTEHKSEILSNKTRRTSGIATVYKQGNVIKASGDIPASLGPDLIGV